MPGKVKPVTKKEVEMAEKLEVLLGGPNKRYAVIDREANLSNPEFGTYRCYASFDNAEMPDSEAKKQLAIHLLNYLDGFLSDQQLMVFAHMASKRALERAGLDELATNISKMMSSAEGGERGN